MHGKRARAIIYRKIADWILQIFTDSCFQAIKPDGVKRKVVGDIIATFEKEGFHLMDIKMISASSQQIENHYREHISKPFFPELMKYFSSGPIVAMVWSGADIVRRSRIMIGATDPAKAEDGTIRKRFGTSNSKLYIYVSSQGSLLRFIKY